MKPASEIHAEVGKQISIADSGKYRAFTVTDIAKIIADAKAESKGVCEWTRIVSPFTRWRCACCGSVFNEIFKHCPGCGKEIKVV